MGEGLVKIRDSVLCRAPSYLPFAQLKQAWADRFQDGLYQWKLESKIGDDLSTLSDYYDKAELESFWTEKRNDMGEGTAQVYLKRYHFARDGYLSEAFVVGVVSNLTLCREAAAEAEEDACDNVPEHIYES